MKKYTIRSLLTRTDEITEQRIAKQFPLTTDMETVFQRSLAKLGEDAEPANRSVSKKQLTMIRYLSAAACLILTIGLSVGVWAKRQKIEPLPPQETQTTTITQTETRTETTAQVTTESQVTEKKTAPTTQITNPVATLPEVIASYTTAVQTPAMTTAEHTAAATTAQTLAATTAAPTLTAVTAAPITTTYEWHYGTIPTRNPEQSAVIVTTQVPMTAAATTIETEATFPFTTEVTDPSERLPGFDIADPNPDNNQVEIKFQSSVFPSPEEQLSYKLDLDSYNIKLKKNYNEDKSNNIYYSIYEGYQKKYVICLEIRTEFSFSCFVSNTLMPADVNSNPGVWVVSSDQCTLYWDDGYYTLSIRGNLDEQEVLLEIARNFHPCEIEETEPISE